IVETTVTRSEKEIGIARNDKEEETEAETKGVRAVLEAEIVMEGIDTIAKVSVEIEVGLVTTESVFVVTISVCIGLFS
ncbi:unnamed protein product, partial [Strongylus vulgaris]